MRRVHASLVVAAMKDGHPFWYGPDEHLVGQPMRWYAAAGDSHARVGMSPVHCRVKVPAFALYVGAGGQHEAFRISLRQVDKRLLVDHQIAPSGSTASVASGTVFGRS